MSESPSPYLAPVSKSRSLLVHCPLPPRVLHPNARPHWAERARVAAQYRSDVAAYLKAALAGRSLQFARAWLDLEYVFASNRRRDDDGLAAFWKNGRDAIVDCGIVPDDSTEYLCMRRLTWRRVQPGEPPGVIVTIEEVRDGR